MKVLVVDGSTQERQAIVEALACIDEIAIQGALADTRSAVRVMANDPPDIVVTCAREAEPDAMELIAAARIATRAPTIVVVGCDGSRDETSRSYLEAGASLFVERDEDLSELVGVIGTLVTRARSLSIDDALRLLGRMATSVAHELDNYLGAIDVALGLLERTPSDPAALRQAREGMESATRLVQRLTAYVQGQPPPMLPLDFGDLVSRTVDLVRPSLSHKIQLLVYISDRLRPVRGAATELEQLVLNLVINAADKMPSGGQLVVRVASTSTAAVLLEITDTGSLMDTQLLVEDQSARLDRRMGLGLGIVRRVVSRHAGAFRLVPRRDRPGAIATVILPAE